jgi:hypothetical protein
MLLEAMAKEIGPAPPEYDSNGVDLTLIRWMMDMTPAERLETLQAVVNVLWEARETGADGAPPSFRQQP